MRLLALLLALAVAGASGQAWENGTVFTICTAAWTPMVECDPRQPQDQFTGFDVEMFREAASLVGWEEGVNYNWKCWTDWDGMMADLLDDNGTCLAAAAGITVSSEREKMGYEFTYPTYRSSLGVLVSTSVKSSDGWGFVRPFDWTVWLAVGLTVLAFPFIAFVIEFMSVKGRIVRSEVLPGYRESAVRGMWTMLLLEPFHLSSFGARVTALCYGFLATILINTYCANLAAALTVTSINSQIRSVADLRGKAVGTEEFYADRLRNKYGIFTSSPYFEDYQEGLAQAVRSGELVAWITDEPLVQHVAAVDKQCSLGVLSETIEPFDYALAFHKGASREEFVDLFSGAVLKLQEQGVLSQLRNNYITVQQDGCGTAGSINQETNSIQFKDVYGLWVILAAGIVVGACFTMHSVWRRSRRRAQSHTLEGTKEFGSGRTGGSEDVSVGDAGLGGALPNEADQSKPLVSFLRSMKRQSFARTAKRVAKVKSWPKSMRRNSNKDGSSLSAAEVAAAQAVAAADAEAAAAAQRPRSSVRHSEAVNGRGGHVPIYEENGEDGDLEAGSRTARSARASSGGSPLPPAVDGPLESASSLDGGGSARSAGGGGRGGKPRRTSELEKNKTLFSEGWREASESSVFGGNFGPKGGGERVFDSMLRK